MAASVNFSHSEERSGKRSMENRDRSSLSRSMYEWCKASAIRDFPEECGPFASGVHPVLKADIADIGSAKVEDNYGGHSGDYTVKTSKCEDDFQHFELKRTSFPTEFLYQTTDFSLKNENLMVSSHHVDGLRLDNDNPAEVTSVGMEALEDTWLTGIANSVKCESSMPKSSSPVGEVALSGGSNSLCNFNVSGSSACIEKAITRRYVPQRKLAAVRDFPPFCGRNAPILSKDECLKKFSLNNKRVSQHKSAVDDNSLGGKATTIMKEVENHIQDEYACKRKLVNIVEVDPERNATKKVKKIDGFEPSEMNLTQEKTREKLLTLPQESNHHPHEIGTRKKVGFFACLDRSKAAIKRKDAPNIYGYKPLKKKFECATTDDMGQLVGWDKDSLDPNEHIKDFRVVPKSHGFNSVNVGDSNEVRNKVRETLSMFQALLRKLMQEVEGKSNERENSRRRVDFEAAKILKEEGKYVNTGKQILGSVPGIEVGDKFQYRVELNIIGLHRQSQGGIDYVKHNGKVLATSIVASGGYANEVDNSDVLIYTGQGGNVMSPDKEPEDQKLERGNLALKNSSEVKNPVRVIHGYESMDGRSKALVYDGQYLVESYWQEMGSHGKLLYKFQMRRIPGQPELAFKKPKKSNMWF
ncbi:hypothetical protein Lal_00027468 [Lupinus albus]|uniref:Putative methyltransferase n=1 Tax=Lupinus albus TaxID=3870 RepID=A0A6A5MQC7_LUPAL|nr:putative methyltransferase [Lupinus albus]KAF1873430.1 hypothetical protein Lal_00027468 [Lupinus albus]